MKVKSINSLKNQAILTLNNQQMSLTKGGEGYSFTLSPGTIEAGGISRPKRPTSMMTFGG